jgi:hypothetical protein
MHRHGDEHGPTAPDIYPGPKGHGHRPTQILGTSKIPLELQSPHDGATCTAIREGSPGDGDVSQIAMISMTSTIQRIERQSATVT